MTKWLVALSGLSISLIISGTSGAADVNTSPGKQQVYISTADQPFTLEFGDQIFPTAVIAKGKSKHVLVVTATVFVFGFQDKWISMYPAVNNYFLQPPFSQGFTACPASASSTCALTATWIADLDTLEAAAPGAFIGQPLNVTFSASDLNATGTTRSISGTLIVRMEKKK